MHIEDPDLDTKFLCYMLMAVFEVPELELELEEPP